MSIICLICKDKLLNNAPGSPLGSLNSLIENQVIATGCGHLYHQECLQCWFRTQKKKLQNQGTTESLLLDYCPTCQCEVHDEHIRRIYLLEDHREALEKAKFLERMENLEIYCHQLEISVQQLHRENDMLLNKALSPSKSTNGKEEFAAIVKNDRVMWLKKDSVPLSGVVQSIFKKDGSLWVKLKLDKKIRTNQRSGLLGSFRFDKKQEWTVPFEDIVLERDFKKNNIIDEENGISEPHPVVVSPLRKPSSFRSSTMSLPGEYLGQTFFAQNVGNGQKLQPVLSYDFINNYGSNMELTSQVNNESDSKIIQIVDNNITQSNARETGPVISSVDEETDSLGNGNDQQRDYVVLTPKPAQPTHHPLSKQTNEGRTSPQDGKAKHVTFADDLLKNSISNKKSMKGNHFRDHGYKNVTEMTLQGTSSIDLKNSKEFDTEQMRIIDLVQGDLTGAEELPIQQISPLHTKSKDTQLTLRTEPSTSSTPCSSSHSISGEMQLDVFIDSFGQSIQANDSVKKFNNSCFDITLTVLFYESNVFDDVLHDHTGTHDQIQQAVQQILTKGFVNPLRNSEIERYSIGYSNQLYEAISHLCSSYLDLEELMTILFEYVFKLPPFISYSYDMCDYIHQFFIDFTDKERKPTVQQLFEQSLKLQDNLKLCREPSPALLLQMPSSEDGIIHYQAIIPSLTLKIEHFLENEPQKTDALTCYCNKTATLECSTCARIHGKSPVLFCDDCSVLLKAIHDQMYHKLELSPIKAINISSFNLELAAVICLKSEKYSAFIRKTNAENEYNSKWMLIDDFEDGKPKVETLWNMEEWVESLISDPSNFNISSLNRIQQKLLMECRMFMYLPAYNSFA